MSMFPQFRGIVKLHTWIYFQKEKYFFVLINFLHGSFIAYLLILLFKYLHSSEASLKSIIAVFETGMFWCSIIVMISLPFYTLLTLNSYKITDRKKSALSHCKRNYNYKNVDS